MDNALQILVYTIPVKQMIPVFTIIY